MSFSSLFSFRSSPPAPAVRPASRRAQALRPAAPLLAAVAALALIQAAALLRPSQARAWCDCGSISSIVNAAARRVIDGIAAPLQSAIKAAAGYQTQYLHRDLAALQEAVVAGAESLAAAMQAADRSQARRAAEKTWDETAQSPVICGADEMGQGLQRSWRGSEEALTAVMDKARERRGRFRRPADFLDEAARA
ncbi:MAG: hypothetical protein LBU12_06200, partial [Deltaproteobacteria bacterium]|nr:hypothetical protein [Deltaproteobacteria bacterium]